jgi:hypothetical protein
MSDQRTSEAEKVDLGKGSREELQGGPEPDKGKEAEPDEKETAPIPPRPSR